MHLEIHILTISIDKNLLPFSNKLYAKFRIRSTPMHQVDFSCYWLIRIDELVYQIYFICGKLKGDDAITIAEINSVYLLKY